MDAERTRELYEGEFPCAGGCGTMVPGGTNVRDGYCEDCYAVKTEGAW